MKLSGPRSKPSATQKRWQSRESNPRPLGLQAGTLTTIPQRRPIQINRNIGWHFSMFRGIFVVFFNVPQPLGRENISGLDSKLDGTRRPNNKSTYKVVCVLGPSNSELKLSYDRLSVGLSISLLVSNIHLRPMTTFVLLLDCCGFVDVGAPSLT
jgi:hypothetical protein